MWGGGVSSGTDGVNSLLKELLSGCEKATNVDKKATRGRFILKIQATNDTIKYQTGSGETSVNVLPSDDQHDGQDGGAASRSHPKLRKVTSCR